MQTTNVVDLLLSKLPLHACMAHRLPKLMNNLLLVSVLVNAGCEVFFHATGCEVTFNGGVILQGWQDPKNRLWRVRIIDNGWTTKLTIADYKKDHHQKLPLMALANSLYECENTSQLTQ